MKIEIKNHMFEVNKIECLINEYIDERLIMLHNINNLEYSYDKLSRMIGNTIMYNHNIGLLEQIFISNKHIFLNINLKKKNNNIIEIKHIPCIIEGKEIYNRTITLYSENGKEIFEEVLDNVTKDVTKKIWCSNFKKIS